MPDGYTPLLVEATVTRLTQAAWHGSTRHNGCRRTRRHIADGRRMRNQRRLVGD
jgi:hypothetical protein